MRLLSLFSGIGAFEKALENLGINYDLVGFSEIDKYAVKSYCAVHNVSEDLNLGDITKIDVSKLPKDIDVITHGSPCQSFSIAGKQHGGDKGSGTRSSLMWNTVDIVEHTKPKYVIWENVKNLVSNKHRHNFDSYLITMRNLGYNSYYKVLNSKDYGVPQNRERVYVISIRKDIDDGTFTFPLKEKLNKRLKDVLESEVSEHFYLNDDLVKKFIYKEKLNDSLLNDESGNSQIVAKKTNVIGNLNMNKWYDLDKRIYDVNTYAPTLATQQGGNSGPKILESKSNDDTKDISNLQDSVNDNTVKVNRLGGLYDDDNGQRQGCSVFDKNGLSPTITTGHCFSQPFVIDDENKTIKYNGKNVELPAVCASRGRNPDNPSDRTLGQRLEQRIEVNTDGVSNTLTTFQKDNYVLEENKEDNYSYVEKKYKEFYDKNGYIPEFFNPYNGSEIKDIAPTQTTNCGSVGSSASVLKADKSKVQEINKNAKHQQDLVQHQDDISRTIPAGTHGSTPHLLKTIVNDNPLRIRRLTPLECWRLMGFSDEDFMKAKNVPTSDTQLYKQAGNSIVVTVLERIFKNLFKDEIKSK